MEKLFHGHMKIIFLVTVKMLCILFCKMCRNLYFGLTQDFKQRLAKHKFMSKTHMTVLAEYSQNTLDYNQAELYFQIFPLYYKTNTAL